MPEFSAAGLLHDPEYHRLKRAVIDITGMAYYEDKDSVLSEHFFNRMVDLKIRQCGPYLEILSDPIHRKAELDHLIDLLAIGETYFFRHREQFDALRDKVIPEILERNRNVRRMRIWSAGCSNGAEAYSLSLLLRDELAGLIAGWEIEIIGTDMNPQALSLARAGIYPEWAFRGVAEDLRKRCFRQAGKSWEILPAYRKGVSFHSHNLVDHPLPSFVPDLAGFDVIVCRNVLIYFSQEVALKTVAKMGHCLVPGGWFVPGYAELGSDLFTELITVPAKGATLFRKPAGADAVQAPLWSGFQFGADDPRKPVTPSLPSPKPEKAMPSAKPIEKSPPAIPVATTEMDLENLRRLCDEGRLDEAALECERLIRNDSLNAELRFQSGLISESLGKHSEAAQAMSRTLYLDPDYLLAHYYLGLFQKRDADKRGASRSFRNALRLLDRQDGNRVFRHADGATAADLSIVVKRHLESLEKT